MITKFQVKASLAQRGPNEQQEDQDVKGLRVATGPVATFVDDSYQGGHYGSDTVKVFPAIQSNKPCFMVQRVWCPANGYSASGCQEDIVSFSEGNKLIAANK